MRLIFVWVIIPIYGRGGAGNEILNHISPTFEHSTPIFSPLRSLLSMGTDRLWVDIRSVDARR